MLTDFLGLTLTDASETSMLFLEWRKLMNGVGVNSNMELLDAAMARMNAAVNGKADGFTLDPYTGVLQLTTGGTPIPGAAITVNLNQYYTKEEVNSFLEDLEASMANNTTILDIQSNAIGDLDYDSKSGALTMYNLNGEQIGDTITIVGGGGGGGGDSYSMRLVSGMPSTSMTVATSSATELIATFYEYYGNVETGVAGSLAVDYKLSNETEWKSYTTKIVNMGVPFRVDVTEILTLGATTNVRLSVTGGESLMVRSLTYNITQVEASIEALNFNAAAVYTGNFDFQYKCVGRNLKKTVHFEMDGVECATADIGTSHNTTQTQTIQMLGKYTYGVHDLCVYFTTPDGATSNVLRFAVMYNNGTSSAPIIGALATREEITYGDALTVDYAVFTPNRETTAELTIRVYSIGQDGSEVNYSTNALENIPNNVSYTWQGVVYPPSGMTYIEFKSAETVRVLSVLVKEIETEYDLQPVSANLVYHYSSAGRSNNDSNKELYQYKYTTANGVVTNIQGTFDGFNWVSNGYVDGEALTLSGTAVHTIRLPMFSTSYVDEAGQMISLESAAGSTVTTNGRTFEVELKVSNVTDIKAQIIKCMSSDHAGFIVTPQNCWLLSSNGTDVVLDDTGFIENEENIAAAYIKDGTRIRLSFVIEAKGTVQYHLDDGTAMSGQCVNIYIDGQYANSFVYPDNARYAQSEFITIGSDTCVTNIYDVRVYNRGLTAAEIMQNYKASPISVYDRLLRFEDNDVLNDDGDVDYEKAIKKYNCMLITGPLSPYKGANGKKTEGKYECGTTLTKPDGEGGYVTEFNLLDKTDDGIWVGANNVQGTSSQKFPIKNYKVYLAKLGSDGKVSKVKYSLKGLDANGNQLSIGESTLCWKADFMSSDHANTFNANLADTLFTDKTAAQVSDPRVQNTIYGFRCLLFQRDDENSPIRFAGDGALNNDKGNSKTFGLEVGGDSGNNTTRQKWEFLNNTEALCSFLTDRLFESVVVEGGVQKRAVQGLESTYPDQGDLKDDGLEPNYDYIQTLFTWVCQRANFWDASAEKLETPLTYNGAQYTTERAYRKAIFLNELERHFNKNHMLVYYLFMEFVALCDNRAKNMFLQCMDVHTESLVDVNGNPMSIRDAIDMTTGEVNADMIDWERSTFAVWYPVLYDLDSCFGVENSGYLQIPYYADWNYHLNNTQKFNGRESVLWLMVEEALAQDLQDEAKKLSDRPVGGGGLNYENLYEYHIRNNAQLICPAVVNRDMEYKFSDPWVNGFIDYSSEGNPTRYISDYKYMQRGSRTEQKDAFIYRRANMLYSKYKCKKFLNNNINFRCGTNGGVPASNSGITVEANQVLYPAIKFGDGDAAVISGAKTQAGVKATITKPGTQETDKVGFSDTIYIAGGTFLTDIGDISKFRPYELQLQNAINLKKLTLGSDRGGYVNSQLKSIDTSGCKILEEINIMGCNSLGAVDLSKNGLIKRVLASNSSAMSIMLPNGGVLEELYLGTVSDIVVMNQIHLKEFSCDSYDSVTALRVENTPVIPTQEIVETRLPHLTGGLRLVGIDWTVNDTELLSRLVSHEARGKYVDNNGVLSDDASLYPYISGTVHCASIGSYLISQLHRIYPDLVIDVDENNIIEQYLVAFRNYDGTILDEQYIMRGSGAEDPVTRAVNPIPTPTKPSSVSTIYTYVGWDAPFDEILEETTIYVVYSETVREYTVQWYNGTTKLKSVTVPYGTCVEYDGPTPTNTSMDVNKVYHLFKGWDKSTGCVEGDLVVAAQYDQAMSPTDKQLAEMTPAELNALIKDGILDSTGMNNNVIISGDQIDLRMGHDYDFNNVESIELIGLSDSPRVFDGTNYYNTGIALFGDDSPFTLVIDCSGATVGSLVSCYETHGFRLVGTDGHPQIHYGTSYTDFGNRGHRDIVVIRRKRGDTNLYVYAANKLKDKILEKTFASTLAIKHKAPLSFGARVTSDGYVDSYAKGKIYWSKLWKADLGEIVCRQLVAWPREPITMQAAGSSETAFRMFKRTDNDKFVNCTFLMKHLLSYDRGMNTTDTIEGGWPASNMRTWLNTRVYNGLPDQWRILLQNVQVKSAISADADTVVTLNDYIWFPSIYEINGSTSNSVYSLEGENTFNIFPTTSSKIKGSRDGTWKRYYNTRSAGSNQKGFVMISSEGYTYTDNYGHAERGVCFGFCI